MSSGMRINSRFPPLFFLIPEDFLSKWIKVIFFGMDICKMA